MIHQVQLENSKSNHSGDKNYIEKKNGHVLGAKRKVQVDFL